MHTTIDKGYFHMVADDHEANGWDNTAEDYRTLLARIEELEATIETQATELHYLTKD